MSSTQINIFATRKDLIPVIKDFEAKNNIKYALTGLHQNFNQSLFLNSLINYEKLGYVHNGDWIHNPSFLIKHSSQEINVREVPQKKGGTFYAIDQLINNDSVVFKPSGNLNDKALICGSLTTGYDSEISKELFKAFASEIKKHFKKLKQCYIGEEARLILKAGGRLTESIDGPPTWDLKEI